VFSVIFVNDTPQRVIVGVDVANAGSDKAELAPVIDQVQVRAERLPDDWLMDGGFVTRAAVETGADKGVCIIA